MGQCAAGPPAGKGVAEGLHSVRSMGSEPNMKRPSSVVPQCMFALPLASRAASTRFWSPSYITQAAGRQARNQLITLLQASFIHLACWRSRAASAFPCSPVYITQSAGNGARNQQNLQHPLGRPSTLQTYVPYAASTLWQASVARLGAAPPLDMPWDASQALPRSRRTAAEQPTMITLAGHCPTKSGHRPAFSPTCHRYGQSARLQG